MAQPNAIALKSIPDCRWSRPGHRITGVADDQQPEAAWVCVRTGERLAVREHDCADCAHHEREAATQDVKAFHFAAAEPVADDAGYRRAVWSAALAVSIPLIAVMAVLGAPMPNGFVIAAAAVYGTMFGTTIRERLQHPEVYRRGH